MAEQSFFAPKQQMLYRVVRTVPSRKDLKPGEPAPGADLVRQLSQRRSTARLETTRTMNRPLPHRDGDGHRKTWKAPFLFAALSRLLRKRFQLRDMDAAAMES